MSQTIAQWEQDIAAMTTGERQLRSAALEILQLWPEYKEHYGSNLELIYAFATVMRRKDDDRATTDRLLRAGL